jgi:integrase
MPEREVRKIAAETLRPMNQGLMSVGSATKFADYVEEVYKPTVLLLFTKTTQDRYSSVLKVHLLPMFGEACLRDLTPLSIQKYLSGLASTKLGYESCDKIRDVLSSVLGSAVKYELLVKNPVEGMKIPPAKRAFA